MDAKNDVIEDDVAHDPDPRPLSAIVESDTEGDPHPKTMIVVGNAVVRENAPKDAIEIDVVVEESQKVPRKREKSVRDRYPIPIVATKDLAPMKMSLNFVIREKVLGKENFFSIIDD